MTAIELYDLKCKAQEVLREVISVYGLGSPQWLECFTWVNGIHVRMIQAMLDEGIMTE